MQKAEGRRQNVWKWRPEARVIPAFCILHSSFCIASARHRWHKGKQRMKKLLCLGLVCLGWTLRSSRPGTRRRPPPSRYFRSAWRMGITMNSRWRAITGPTADVSARCRLRRRQERPGQGLAVDSARPGGRLGRQPGAHLQDHVRPARGGRRLLPAGARLRGYARRAAAGPDGRHQRHRAEAALPPGAGDGSLTNPKLGKNYSLQQVFPAALLQAGQEHHHACRTTSGQLGAL